MAQANQNHNANTIRIPFFDPDDRKLAARPFVTHVEMARNAAGRHAPQNGAQGELIWSQQQTASNAILAMRGKASVWIQNLTDRGDVAIQAWDTLKPLFLARFVRTADVHQKAMVMANLKQHEKEEVLDFRDRVISELRILWDDWPEMLEANNARQENARLRAWASEMVISIVLANGFLPCIREPVNNQAADNLETLVTNALRIEANVKRSASVKVSTVHTESHEVAAVRAGQNPKQGPRPGGSGPGKKFSGRCWWCAKSGHRENNCFAKRDGKPKVAMVNDDQAPPDPPASWRQEKPEEIGYLDFETQGNGFLY